MFYLDVVRYLLPTFCSIFFSFWESEQSFFNFWKCPGLGPYILFLTYSSFISCILCVMYVCLRRSFIQSCNITDLEKNFREKFLLQQNHHYKDHTWQTTRSKHLDTSNLLHIQNSIFKNATCLESWFKRMGIQG